MSHLFLFGFVFVYYEILLRIFSGKGVFSNLIYPILFGITAAFFVNIFVNLLNKKINRIITLIILSCTSVFFITECLIQKTFNFYLPPSQILNRITDIATGYTFEALMVIITGFIVIILYMLPVLLYYKIGKKFMPAFQYRWPVSVFFTIACCIVFAFSSLTVVIGGKYNLYKDNYQFTTATETFGLLTSLRLSSTRKDSSFTVQEKEEEEEEQEDTSVKNVMNLDFDSLSQTDEDPYKEIDAYVASLTGTNQNKYTGVFKGKSIIIITAEAFCDAAVSEELTPTLYRLIHNGFYFSDYYQPYWGGSTVTGEYAVLTGLVGAYGVDTTLYTIDENNYFTLPNQLQREGYLTGAYHNYQYDYYNRNETHVNFGFNYWLAEGNGLESITGADPNDETMISATLDTYIDSSPFCMYYLTIDGHHMYTTESEKYQQNIEHVQSIVGDQYSDVTMAYLCYQYQLEKALTTLVEKLEAYGMADDVVICLTGDHYPGGLSQGVYDNEIDYYAELRGLDHIENNQELDRNNLIIWSKCLEEGGDLHEYQCEISSPTYSLDILPTLSNLFGLEYDSRLMVGRDVFSDAEAFVVWSDYSWSTEKGHYSAYTDAFYPYKEGDTVSQEYLNKYSELAQNKVYFSQAVLNNDYYGHLFGTDDLVDSTELWEEKRNY